MLEDRRQLLEEDVHSTVGDARPVVVTLTDLARSEEACDELVAGRFEIHRPPNYTSTLLEPAIESLSLVKGARETVEDRAPCGIGLLEATQDSLGDHIVRQQVPPLHHVS